MKLKLLRPFPENFKISSPFGFSRTLTIDGKENTHVHKGIDFAVPVGTPVRSFADGKIFKTGWEALPEMFPLDYMKRGLGLRIWMTFDYEGLPYYGWLGHLSRIDGGIVEGAKIKAGEIVGLSGNTGSSTGPHCHVQFRRINTPEMMDAEFYT